MVEVVIPGQKDPSVSPAKPGEKLAEIQGDLFTPQGPPRQFVEALVKGIKAATGQSD